MSERKIRKIGVTNFPSSRRVRGRKANVVRNPNYKAGPNGQNPRGYHPECPGYRACVNSGGTMGSDCQCTYYAKTSIRGGSGRGVMKPRQVRGGVSLSAKNRVNRKIQQLINRGIGRPPAIGHTGSNMVMDWLIDCGSAGSTSVSCSEGVNAGFTEGGTVTYGSISCTTTSDCHEHIA